MKELVDLPDDVARRLCACGGAAEVAKAVPDATQLKRVAGLHKALSDPRRLRILHLLKGGPLCVCVLKEILRISDSKLSYHLAILKTQRLISGKKSGNWITYRITASGLRAIADY